MVRMPHKRKMQSASLGPVRIVSSGGGGGFLFSFVTFTIDVHCVTIKELRRFLSRVTRVLLARSAVYYDLVFFFFLLLMRKMANLSVGNEAAVCTNLRQLRCPVQ